MEAGLNFEALGVSGILVAVLFWLLMQCRSDLKDAHEKTESWQTRAFDMQANNQEQLYEALKTVDKVMDVMERKSAA